MSSISRGGSGAAAGGLDSGSSVVRSSPGLEGWMVYTLSGASVSLQWLPADNGKILTHISTGSGWKLGYDSINSGIFDVGSNLHIRICEIIKCQGDELIFQDMDEYGEFALLKAVRTASTTSRLFVDTRLHKIAKSGKPVAIATSIASLVASGKIPVKPPRAITSGRCPTAQFKIEINGINNENYRGQWKLLSSAVLEIPYALGRSRSYAMPLAWPLPPPPWE
ncbi:Glycerophosphodiester phosphodiesterase GDPDL7 [Senna tora]|uniref:Glycerophosphodiester phosphodiesterase GDPDL7 n=1 Tax=Senna tora TaxID=362788 RepID=A0A834SS37_9FABA|nr:Glycerophosphodiester phosphodiesterase GDPDL7 [Senna tora]